MKQLTEAFYLIAQLAIKLGHEDIKQLDGCLEIKIDEKWEISMNGHEEKTKDTKGVGVPRFSVVIYCNDMPSGIVGVTGGALMGVCEDEFIEAINNRINQA